MDVVAVLVIIAIVSWVALWRQREVVKIYTAAQREVLERQKEALTVQAESVNLQREATRLLGAIAKALTQKDT